MNLSEVLRNFLLISGVNENESGVYMPILKDAIHCVRSKLKDENIKEEDKLRIYYATAVLAFHKYMLLKRAKTITGSFAAGDLNIKNDLDASVKATEDIWLSAKEEIIDLLKDDEFLFLSVPTYKYCY